MLALVLATLLFQEVQDPPPAPPPPAVEVERAAPAPKVPPVPAVREAPAVPRIPPVPAADGGKLRGDWSRPSGKRITIEDTTSIDDALEAIADAAGWNVVLNTGRTGHKLLVLRLRNVPAEDALRAALEGTELVATRKGAAIVVAPGGAAAPPAPVPTLAGFDKPTGRRFTGEFQETPVNDALRQIAKAANLSIVLPTGVGNVPVSAAFREVPVEDALRAVLEQAELVAEREGTLVTVRRAPAQLPFLPPGFAADARRLAEDGMREAQRAMREAQREAEDVADWGGRDRHVTGSDLVVATGERARDVNVVRGNLRIATGGQARDVSTVSGSVDLESGAVAREVVAVLGSVRLQGGASARQVVAVGGNVEIGPGAVVDQDVVSIGGRVTIDPEAEVGGSRQSIAFPGVSSLVGFTADRFFGGGTPSPLWVILEALVKFAVLFVLGLLVLSLFPRRLEAVSGAMIASPLKATFAGLLGTVAMPILLVLLVVTVVGILLVPVQIIAVLAAGLLGVTAFSFLVGRALPFQRTQASPTVVQLAIGTGIFVVLTAIPLLGGLVWVAVWLLAFGAVLRTRFGQNPPGALPTTAIPPVQPPTVAA